MIDPVKIAKDVKQFRDRIQSPAVLELFSIMAQEKFAKYTAYVRAGFNHKQALELVIRDGQQ